MSSNPRRVLLLIIVITILTAWISLPSAYQLQLRQGPINLNQTISRPLVPNPFAKGQFWGQDFQLHTGLDIQGGSHLVFEADMTSVVEADREAALESTKSTIERRVNLYGVSEPLVQTSQVGDSYRIIIELPGVQDVAQAIELIGETAQLEFRTPSTSTDSAQLYESSGLTGKHLKRSTVQFDQETSEPIVSIEFDQAGTEIFADLTKRFVGWPIAIYLDEELVSDPVVNSPILTGQAIITGSNEGFTIEEAKDLSIKLNAGALPVPVKRISQQNVGATLGTQSVNKSVVAGLIGLLAVMTFMIGYYGRLGLIANIGLVVYGLVTLALYKIFSVTLTLPGIAGFILSVGMAVDANILIFERFKEEIRAGRRLDMAMEQAFGRAWDSIRDANICTLITCFILFNPLNWSFLNTSGPIRGFALTLALGIGIGLFTGIIVTRTLIRVFYLSQRSNPHNSASSAHHKN
jgi:preprotein translocase subunit SecD